jgi:hypothetical protein
MKMNDPVYGKSTMPSKPSQTKVKGLAVNVQ